MIKPHYKILLVEDSPDDRTICKLRLLRDPDHEYTIWEEALGKKGLTTCQTMQPDCILVDFQLPDIDGLQFLTRLQEQSNGQTPAVVMVTGSGHENIAVEAMKRGAQDYLVKDLVTQEALWWAVDNAIDKVTLRRNLERQHQQLQESEARFRALVNAVPAMVWIAAPDGTMTFVTDQWLTYCGMTTEQLARDWVRLVIHPDDYERCVIQWAQARALGTDYEIEVRNRRHDGEYRWFLTRAVPTRDEAGRIIGWYGTTTDIHDRKQAEETLRQQAEIIDQVHDAVIATDMAGLVTSWNKGAERLFGYTTAEMVGKSVHCLFPSELRAEVPALLQTLQARGQHEVELRQLRKSGGEFYAHLSLSQRRDDQGHPIGMIGYAIDITARRQAELAVQRMNEELQQFAYIVSHDLNEPLRTMSGFVRLLANRFQGKLDADADECLTFITDGCQRMQQLLVDLLAYTRLGGKKLTRETVDCEVLFARVCTDLQSVIHESGATITHDPLPTLQADATLLGQVFQNLLSNAFKFRGAAPPRVHVSAQQEHMQWCFSVSDHGIGLDPSQAERIFQVFQRLHSRTEYAGTGIGLAICKKIVERHGGRIWVESQPGEGATFFFTVSGDFS